ncbi:MAG: polysaccharide deacetylase family protein [Oscillospiraceae bacterium]|jgi:polysaccharide deacetylase family sporulation protein PdaB|nr:polysaccharide deacetylase family protein [Oscillospiraceae bacterium]
MDIVKRAARFFRKREHVIAGVLLAAIASLLVLANNPEYIETFAANRKLPIYCVQREQKIAAISFDAAWGNEDTQTLIDILARYKVHATFFVVGDWVDKYPESVKALAGAGHEIMSHSSTHAHFSKLSAAQIANDLNACNDKIEAVTGIRPKLFRAPYGEYDDHVIQAVTDIGMTTIQWDVDSLDWKGISAGEITKRVTEKVQPGSIVLFHNAAIHTPEALPGILESLIRDGYAIVPISEILLDGEYTIDHTGRQLPKSSG